MEPVLNDIGEFVVDFHLKFNAKNSLFHEIDNYEHITRARILKKLYNLDGENQFLKEQYQSFINLPAIILILVKLIF